MTNYKKEVDSFGKELLLSFESDVDNTTFKKKSQEIFLNFVK